MSNLSQHRWTSVLFLLGAVILGGCAGSEPAAVSPRKEAPSRQVDAVQRAADTEDPTNALRILQEAGGQAGPVVLTLRGALLAEIGRFARAARAMQGALRLVEKDKGLAAKDAGLPRFRPTPDQRAPGDLPAVTATTERSVVMTLREAVQREVTNEALLRALKERPVPVRWPPVYEGGAGLSLEMMRQHFGDQALRIRLLPYRPVREGEDDQTQAAAVQDRRRIAAQNLIIASILARDATRLKRGQEALRAALSQEKGQRGPGLQGAHRSALYLALAEYLLGQRVQAGPLPQKARRLFRAGM